MSKKIILIMSVLTLIMLFGVLPLQADTAQCSKHKAPKDLCFICDASLRDTNRLWCKEHDRYEDRCFICHPEIKEADRAYCTEHFLYEDECILCQPNKGSKIEQKTSAAKKTNCSLHEAPKNLCFICDPSLREKGRLWCTEHARYEDRCFDCHPDLIDTTRAFCEEHALYEDECFLCKAQLQTTSKPTVTNPTNEAKCKQHNATKNLCFICDSSLRDKGRLWCKEHSRYENRCFLCHPDIRSEDRLYCEKHYLYQDECFLCNPVLKVNGSSEKSSPNDKTVLFCNEHNVPEHECGICQPDLIGDLIPGEGMKVRFASLDAANLAGVVTARPQFGPFSDGIEVLAELRFNQNEYAKIVAPVEGILRSVETKLGSTVDEHEVLARIWSAEIGEAVTKAVLAKQNLERERKLRAERISSEKELQEAVAVYQASYQTLRSLGFEDHEIASFDTNQENVAELHVCAPFAGEIVERNAVRGSLVEAGQPLFALADRSTVWAMLTVPEKDISRVRVGQTVELQLFNETGSAVIGKLEWIAAKIDPRTRMISARAELPNPNGKLRDGMFVRCRILTGGTERSTLIPSTSIQSIEGHSFVFVKIEDDLFEARRVKLGTRYNGDVEILTGLEQDDDVAIEHTFLLKSQFLISRLGAGCVD